MKKLFFGVAVAAIALSASAFTNAPKNDPEPVRYVQTSVDVWQKIEPGLFDENNCLDLIQEACYYEQVSYLDIHDPILSKADINSINSPIIKLINSENVGQYTGDIVAP